MEKLTRNDSKLLLKIELMAVGTLYGSISSYGGRQRTNIKI